jgi:hypothetical protein
MGARVRRKHDAHVHISARPAAAIPGSRWPPDGGPPSFIFTALMRILQTANAGRMHASGFLAFFGF